MNRYLKKLIIFLSLFIFLYGCETTKPKSVHGDRPLIDTSKIIAEGKKEIEKKVIKEHHGKYGQTKSQSS